MTEKEKERIKTLRMEGFSYSKIAKALGVSINTVKSFCRRNSIIKGRSGHPVKEGVKQPVCKMCGKKITLRQGLKKFCSSSCRLIWWRNHPELLNKKAFYSFTCNYCGKRFTSYGNKTRKYCSHSCYIKDRFYGDSKKEKAL